MAQEKWLVNPGQTKTIDIERVRKLKVGLIGGQIDIIGHDEPGARVEVHSVSGKELKISIDGDLLEIDHPQLRWDNFLDVFRAWSDKAGADISVMVPRDVALKLGVVSADALISGLTTDARLSTVSGEITVDGLSGDLDLNAVGGELSVHDHAGAVTAHTVSGDITASGALRSFSADSVSANIYLDVSGTPDRIATNTVSGDVTVRLDQGVSARYRVNAISGRLRVDDTVVRRAQDKSFTEQTGSLDGQWIDVTGNTVSGDISIVRRPSTRVKTEASA
ncbi:DUF4097 family beta strand repeat-containing protein [Rathayibacter soli]|uniref:DUF4097 family beta strand repeat-containing protein n=1 Tax=Rathayibacter soli TaxID=3144168 RepID=UPI0027E47C09|nr:hypothetical protein [Glaciibacter superstes]